MTYDEIAELAWDMVYQRANEEGDIDIDYDYPVTEAWFDEYFAELCKEEGVDLNGSKYYAARE